MIRDGKTIADSTTYEINDFYLDIPNIYDLTSNENLFTTNKIADTKHLLSSEATLYEVKGGNHAQFGMYGTQDGDGKSTISAKEQQDELIKETLKWLNQYQR